ncbi:MULTISPECIES: hypothetical protein [Frankia]|uniref:hypothetical protein n=1 Tax=Frankia TaxID=1854 RepID=UPI0003037AEA|nr:MULTISPECIES: hypothetical protein [Frankia]
MIETAARLTNHAVSVRTVLVRTSVTAASVGGKCATATRTMGVGSPLMPAALAVSPLAVYGTTQAHPRLSLRLVTLTPPGLAWRRCIRRGQRTV